MHRLRDFTQKFCQPLALPTSPKEGHPGRFGSHRVSAHVWMRRLARRRNIELVQSTYCSVDANLQGLPPGRRFGGFGTSRSAVGIHKDDIIPRLAHILKAGDRYESRLGYTFTSAVVRRSRPVRNCYLGICVAIVPWYGVRLFQVSHSEWALRVFICLTDSESLLLYPSRSFH